MFHIQYIRIIYTYSCGVSNMTINNNNHNNNNNVSFDWRAITVCGQLAREQQQQQPHHHRPSSVSTVSHYY